MADDKHAPAEPAYDFRCEAPAQTLKRLAPQLKALGITRLAEISHLDAAFGMYVFSAIRPRGQLLQATAGKGLVREVAMISAIMEAAELFCMENPRQTFESDCLTGRLTTGKQVLRPGALYPQPDRFFSADYRINWLHGRRLDDGHPIWLPACCVHFTEPAPCTPTTHGLAAGTNLSEASVHGVFEWIERDAASRLVKNGRLYLKEGVRAVDPQSLPSGGLAELAERIKAAGLRLLLFQLPALLSLPAYWAFILDPDSFSGGSTVNSGVNAHFDPIQAAVGAVTEAVQSRLTFIQGAREDTRPHTRWSGREAIASDGCQYLMACPVGTSWHDQRFETPPPFKNAATCLQWLVDNLAAIGKGPLIQVDLSHANLDLSVVKMLLPQLYFQRALF